MGANAIGQCGTPNSGIARGELRSPLTTELSGLLPQLEPQFGTISMKDDGGKKAVFAHKISTTGAKRPDLHP